MLVAKNRKISIKKWLTLSLVITLTCSLVGCATSYHRGDGVIISEKKLSGRDFRPHTVTKLGATTGGIAGAAFGGAMGLLFGALAYESGTATIVVSTLAGGAIGALIVGAIGVSVGAGAGYAVDLVAPNRGVYEFIVKPDHESKPLTIRQYTGPIPLNAPVHILEKKGVLFIERK